MAQVPGLRVDPTTIVSVGAKKAEPRYVVQLPNGKAVFSDPKGRINPIPNGDNIVTAAILAGFGGIVLAGTVGGLAGAAVGAVATRFWLNRRSGWHGSVHQ